MTDGAEGGGKRAGLGGVAAGAAVAVAIVAVLAGWWAVNGPVPGAAPESAEPAAPRVAEPVAPAQGEATPAATGAGTGETTAAAGAPAPAAPTGAAEVAHFDVLRVTPEGGLTLAGKTAPGARVEVLLDGAPLDTVSADANGDFVLLATTVAPSAAARVLSVKVTGADGVTRDLAETLTVAPSPEALAQAATAAGAAPEVVAEQVAAAETLAAKPLVTDAAGAEVLAGASEALVIDTLAFGTGGAIEISGRGAPAGVVLRAYVDNAEAGLVQAGADGGWRMQLPKAAPGPHELRVDAIDAAGKVVARAGTSFEATAPETLAASAKGAGAGAGAPAGARVVTIARGNTLWAIARDTYGDPYLYVKLFEANRDQIRDPDLIYPGQVFTLPE
ncbi:LysM peptidoglycan-binding domain-containing protein [Paenirhodobacter hankyongi]|uniref:LysM peptidoglycan-binding domain-containing protein n=1 Tax=Paenirhodobacter hankyongi TaxID=2294033 RepID=A0A421BU77_9RHOB|nr:LysM peptidoglycan-binding domain-containing protein [Sinirhodobacter hankyongi]RLL71839.1 LysM peptidoglycan-binding domain-containing protein [Sinirhodobacter hankyongi]